MGFECERDARLVLEVLPKRFGRYGLELHPTKTRLVKFVRPPWHDPPKGSGSKRSNGSFDFLGFTHYWCRSRQGNWVVKRKTAGSRLSRSARAINQWCRQHRHQKIRDQHRALTQKLQGHYAYFGITGNAPALRGFYRTVRRIWKKWLGRRSQRGFLTWPHYARLPKYYPLPAPVGLVGAVAEKLAQVLQNLGTKHALVVFGEDGFDEVSLSAPTKIYEVQDRQVRSYTITPEDMGVGRQSPDAVGGGAAEENAAALRGVLSGDTGPLRDFTLINAAAALVAGDLASDLKEGVAVAAKSIDSGAALEKLDAFVNVSKEQQ